MKPLLTALLLSVTFLQSGCVSKILQSKVDEPTVFVLRAGTPPAANIAYPVVVSVALPNAAPGLNSDFIAVLRQQQLDHYKNARWAGTAAEMTRSVLLTTLQTQKSLKSVVSDGSMVNADYLLTLELRDFQAEYANDNAAPTIRVTLVGNLIEIKSRRLMRPLSASVLLTARSNHLSEVVTSFETATQQVANQLTTQLLDSLGSIKQ